MADILLWLLYGALAIVVRTMAPAALCAHPASGVCARRGDPRQHLLGGGAGAGSYNGSSACVECFATILVLSAPPQLCLC